MGRLIAPSSISGTIYAVFERVCACPCVRARVRIVPPFPPQVTVSENFHCVYDYHFYTVISEYTNDNLPVPPVFHNFFLFSKENHYDPRDIKQQTKRQLIDIDRRNIDKNEPYYVFAPSTTQHFVHLNTKVPTVTSPQTSCRDILVQDKYCI